MTKITHWVNDYYGFVRETYDVEEGMTEQLIRYVLRPGVKLFAVYATYSKLKPCLFPYYIAAKNMRQAKKIWRAGDSVLSLVERIEQVPDEELDEVLNNPYISIR